MESIRLRSPGVRSTLSAPILASTSEGERAPTSATLTTGLDNTQASANHIHSVWRDPLNDYGADILAQHYATAH